MATLSLCMITKNEEKNLKQCMENAKPFIDELIILDTGSTDKTKEIAKQFTSKIYDFRWCDDFAKARNESISKATKEWVIYIDADEIISLEDWQKIRKLIYSNEADAYILHQRNYTPNKALFDWRPNDSCKECKSDGFFISPIIRLFRNNKNYSFDYKVHETVDKSILEHKGRIRDCQIPVHHYGYLKAQNIISAKREKYLELGLKQIEETPANPRPYYEVAMIYKNTGQYDEAEKYFRKASELNPNYKLVYTNLGDIYAKKGRLKEAIEAYKESIRHRKNENTYLNLGMLLFNLKSYGDAVRLTEKAIEINPENPTAYNNLGLILIKMQKYRDALAVFETAYKRTGLKKFEEATNAIRKRFGEPLKIDELMREKKYEELEKHLKSRIEKNKNDIIAYTHLGNLYLKLDAKKKAVKILEQAIKHNKSNEPLCINLYVNLANLLIESKYPIKAEKAIREALELSPEDEFLKKRLELLTKSL